MPRYAIRFIAGEGQIVPVGQVVPITPMVLVTTVADGLAAPDAPVLFVAGGDSTVAGASSFLTTTGASGIATGLASVSWRLGASALGYALTASIPGTNIRDTCAATATPSVAAVIAAASTQSQSTGVSTLVPTAPSVLVTDTNGNPIAGMTVTFAVTGGGGALTGASPVTNAQGLATLSSWTTGGSPGLNTVTATAASLTGSPVTFTANATATVPTGIALNGGDGQTGIVAGQNGTALSVLVTGAGATPIVGVTVTWTAVTGGGSIPGASVTNGSGIAAAIPTSGVTVGVNTYSATVAGVAGSVPFTLTSVAGAVAELVLQTQPSNAGSSGTALPGQPVVLLRDANHNINLTATTTITATVISGPGSVTAGGTKAAVAGVATFTALTITDVTGQNNLLQFSDGTRTVSAAQATSIAPPVPDRILITTGPTTSTEDIPMGAVVVRVADASNVTVPGYAGAVTVAIGTNPGGSTLTGTLTVNCVNGLATFSDLVLNNIGTGYTLTFTGSVGITPVTSAAFNVITASALYPNLPGGLSTIFWDDCTLTKAVVGDYPVKTVAGQSAHLTGKWAMNGTLSIQTDLTAPLGRPTVTQGQWPGPTPGPATVAGNGKWSWGGWPGTSGSPQFDEIYVSYYGNLKGNGTTYECEATQTKLFFIGSGDTNQGSTNILCIKGAGSNQGKTSWPFYFVQQSNAGIFGTTINRNQNNGFSSQQGVWTVGNWAQTEVYMKMSTLGVETRTPADGACENIDGEPPRTYHRKGRL